MILPAAIACILAFVGDTAAHPGHSDLLSRREAEALYKRQELVARCSSTLHARHEPRMARLEARRAEIIASREQDKGGKDHGGHDGHEEHKTTTKKTSSTTSHKSTTPTTSSVKPSSSTTSTGKSTTLPITSLTSTTTSASSLNVTLSTEALTSTSLSASLSSIFSFNGTRPTGSLPANFSGGFPGMGGDSTSYTATATAPSEYATSFPSSASTAYPASATVQAYDSACALTPTQEEGPFYVQGEALRSNLIDGQPGIPFYAEFTVIDVNTCGALTNSAIDIWSCNYNGDYAGFIASDPATYDTSLYSGEIAHLGDKNDAGSTIADSFTFMRGQQLLDGNGVAQFTTLLPGWYAGRTAHIHLRVHVGGEVTANGTYIGGNLTHTGQTFFGEDVYAQMEGVSPYTQNSVVRTTNDQDNVWTQQNGKYGAWSLYYVVPGDITQGLIGYVTVAVDGSVTA